MPKLDLSLLVPYFERGEDFELTAEQYEEKVKKPLPKTDYHIKNKSPLARMAQEQGFSICRFVNDVLQIGKRIKNIFG